MRTPTLTDCYRNTHSYLFLLLFSALLLAGCSSDSSESAGNFAEKRTLAVEAVQASRGSLPLTERLSGVVRAKNQIELYPEISAMIVEVAAVNGSDVQAGDVLVRLRDTELREQLKQAQSNYQIAVAQKKQADAELERAQAEHRRSLALAEKNLISATELETIATTAVSAEASAELAEARVDQAAATVDERKEELSRTVIRAPVDGTVGNRDAEIGMFVTPSRRLFTLGQLDSVKVEVMLTDKMLGYIKKDQRTEVISDNIGTGSAGAAVSRISPFLHPIAHSTIAEIDMSNDNGALQSGMFVTVDIFYGESENATLVPLSALWENTVSGEVGVYTNVDTLTGEAMLTSSGGQTKSMTDPALFEFVPVNVIAKGRLSAGVSGVDSGAWIVTIGQDLIGPDTGRVRVRPVQWEWVNKQQQMQSEDMLEELIQKKEKRTDTTVGS